MQETKAKKGTKSDTPLFAILFGIMLNPLAWLVIPKVCLELWSTIWED